MKRPAYEVFADEAPDIMEELKKFFTGSQPWLDTPNELLWYRTPRELIGTEQEVWVRNLQRQVKYGIPT